MNKKNPIVFVPLFMLAGGAWRRWFGGGFKKYLPDSRFWKYLVLIIVCFTMYYLADPYFTFWRDWRTYATIAAFAYHWARAIGDWIFVYDPNPDPVRIKWINWVLRHIFDEEQYYTFWWNVTGLFIRFTSTACLVCLCLPSAWFICAGFLTAFSYAVTGKMEKPTDKAEWLAGALNFGLLYLCIGG